MFYASGSNNTPTEIIHMAVYTAAKVQVFDYRRHVVWVGVVDYNSDKRKASAHPCELMSNSNNYN